MTKKSILNFCLISITTALTTNASLIAHYTFDNDGTATVGTNATLGDAASISTTDSQIGAGALSLSGAPTTDTAGTNGAVGGSYSLGTGARTVAFWMKATAGDIGDSNATMISLGSGSSAGNRYDIRLSGNALRLEVQSGGATSSTTVADGTWHHVAVVSGDSATVASTQYYLDGTLAGSFTGSSTSINTGTGALRMGDGYQDDGRDFKGLLDDVRLYDEVLDATTIAGLAAIPEPSSTALLGLGGLALILRRRK